VPPAGPAPLVLVVPGLAGSGPEHWQTRWESRYPRHARVQQRDWCQPDREAWLSALEKEIAAAPEPVVLVAHSLGCALVVHLARRSPALPVRAALLVAPADVDSPDRTPPETRCFAPMPLERLPYPTTVVISRDDPFVSFERGCLFADAWGAERVDVGAAGHINAASGLGDWPAGRDCLERLVARAPTAT
jgi:predicted alpha/beta hydrolase family esterase